MTTPRHARLFAVTRGQSALSRRDLDGLLRGIGAHPSFTDAILGDLAEERARRTSLHGDAAAAWWYLREAVRSIPYLLWNALRHGGVRGRTRVAGLVVAVACIPAIMLLVPVVTNGPPVRLDVERQGGRNLSDGIVLNSRKPVRLGVTALDARGNRLARAGVRFRWAGGTPMSVSPGGIATCQRRGDTDVRASLGSLSANVRLRCEPVVAILSGGSVELMAGGPTRDLAFRGIGPDGQLVSRLTGSMMVEDSTIATLRESRIVPLAPGRTAVEIRVGDATERMAVTVHEPVPTLEGLRADQRFVAASVHLAPGDTVRWPLPTVGRFWMHYTLAPGAHEAPALAVFGRIRCDGAFGSGAENVACVARAPGAYLRMVNPRTRGAPLTGSLWLERADDT